MITITLLITGCKSIRQAALEGDMGHIKKLLALGVNVNLRTYFGDQGSALHRNPPFAIVAAMKQPRPTQHQNSNSEKYTPPQPPSGPSR